VRKVANLKGPPPADVVPIKLKSDPVVPMPEPVEVPSALKSMGEPDAVWVYRMPDGSAYGAVARWNTATGKEVRPIIWDGEKFVTSGFGSNRPLLNSELASSVPIAPILVVEGEKTADAAARYTPPGWVTVTWSGGAEAWSKSEWSSLSGHPVVIWPDNDEPGLRAASGIQVQLSRLGIESAVVMPPPSFPQAWDLADDIPAGSPKMLTDMMRIALKRVAVLELDEPKLPARSAPPADPDELEDAELRYRALGYDEQTYFIMPYAQQQVHDYTTSQLMNPQGCLEIVNELGHWQELFGDNKGRVDWVAAGSHIMRECTEAGVYDPAKIRERGVWMDRKRAVLHTGDSILVEGAAVNPAKFRSEFIYPRRPVLFEEWDGLDNAAPDSLGRIIREACNKVRWEKAIYGDLLAGWIATAIVCGGLQWRTHAWITGNQGSGKTTVVNQIAGACLGTLAIYPVGESTEAGIRQSVRNDARPVVFDESEATKNKEERRAAVIQLMRQSSSETRGRIMKGTVNHKAVSFTLRSAFLMSSIGVGLKEAADLTRTAVLTVRPPDAITPVQREAQEKQWREFMAACASVPYTAPQQLLARQVNNLKTLRANIEVFKEVIAVSMGNRRLGDQLGTLLAGCHSLISSGEMTTHLAETYLEKYDWGEFTEVKAQREDLALLHHLTGSMVRVETLSSGTQERLVGELIEIAFRHTNDSRVSEEAASAVLKRHGMKVDTRKGGVWIGMSVQNINRIMQSSDYYEGWQKVLERHPYAQRSESPVKFAGQTSRALFLPKQEFVQLEG